MKTRLTTTEKRALAYCETLNKYDGGEIAVEWRRSKMWGYNPVISFRGEKCTNIGGCGYDKLSAALASVLCYLFPIGSESYNSVASTAGGGEYPIRETLNALGWKLEKTASGSAFDGFRLSRKEVA